MSAATRTWLGILPLVMALGAGCGGGSKLDRQLQRGNSFFDKGRYAEAIICYIGALQQDPTHKEAIRQLGLAYYESDDLGRAFPFLKQASAAEPERVDLKTKLAALFLAGGAPDEARALAEEVVEQDPSNLEALVVLADASLDGEMIDDALARLSAVEGVHGAEPRFLLAVGALNLRKGEVGAAEKALTEAVRLAPDNPNAYVVRGTLYAMKGDAASAETDLRRAHELAPPVSLAGLRYATFLRNAGRTDEARAVLNQMLEASPQFVPALYERAALDAAAQDLEASLKGLDAAIAQQPSHVPSLLLRARIRHLQGAMEEADKMVEAVARDFPSVPAAHVEQARIHLRKGFADRAEASLREALRLAPHHTEATLALAELEVRAGQHAAAIRRLRPLANSKSPVRLPAMLLLGSALRMNQQWDEALAVYDDLRTILKDSAEPDFLTGLTLEAAGRPEDARRAFEKALERTPDYVAALSSLVSMDIAAGNVQSARDRVMGQIEKAPGSAGLQYLRASVATRMDDLKEVEAALGKVIELDPQFSVAYRDLGRLYLHLGRTQEAADRFAAARQANPRDAAAAIMLASLHAQEGRAAESEAAYEEVLKIEPRFAPALNNLASLYAHENRNLDRALELAQRARELMPSDPAVADTLGLVALRRKDYRWAQSLLEESASQLPNEPEVWCHLGLARHGMGREAEAREALRRALDASQDFPGRDEARQVLAVLDIPLHRIPPEAEAQLRAARESMPDNPSVLVRLGQLARQNNQPTEAVTLYEQALQASSDFLPALLGLAWLHEGDTEKAMGYARRARELAPGNLDATYALGWAAFRAGDYVWSRSLLSEVAAARGQDAEVLFRLAQSSLMAGRVVDSQQEAERAADANPGTMAPPIGGFLDLLRAYQAGTAAGIEDAAAALQTWDAATPLPELVKARAATGQEAERVYAQLVSRFPNWALPARDLAALRAAEGRSDEETLRLAQLARQRLPDDPVAERTLGLVLAGRGSFSQAIPLLRGATEKNPQDGLALFWLAQCLAEKGPTPEALGFLERATQAGLGEPLQAKAAALLSQWRQPKE